MMVGVVIRKIKGCFERCSRFSLFGFLFGRSFAFLGSDRLPCDGATFEAYRGRLHSELLYQLKKHASLVVVAGLTAQSSRIYWFFFFFGVLFYYGIANEASKCKFLTRERHFWKLQSFNTFIAECLTTYYENTRVYEFLKL